MRWYFWHLKRKKVEKKQNSNVTVQEIEKGILFIVVRHCSIVLQQFGVLIVVFMYIHDSRREKVMKMILSIQNINNSRIEIEKNENENEAKTKSKMKITTIKIKIMETNTSIVE